MKRNATPGVLDRRTVNVDRSRSDRMERRTFITLLGGAAAWPLAARAQQGERARRVGVLMAWLDDDPDILTRVAAFRQELRRLGWSEGANFRIEERFGGRRHGPVAGAGSGAHRVE